MTLMRLFTSKDIEQAIGLYIEFSEIHGYEKERAIAAAIGEVEEGYDATIDLVDQKELPADLMPPGEIVRRLHQPIDPDGE